MSYMQKYADYLKNNPQGYWFKRKVYGWGWVPARWQGWATIVVFVAYLVWIVKGVAGRTQTSLVSDSELRMLLAKILIAVLLLLYVCYIKGEKPRWTWGVPER